MKIYDTSSNLLTERPDYTKGRLLQDPNDPEKYIYTTWSDVPAGDGNGEVGGPKEATSDGAVGSVFSRVSSFFGSLLHH